MTARLPFRYIAAQFTSAYSVLLMVAMLSVSTTLVGCATSGSKATRELDRSAKQFEVPPGQSLIYLCREEQFFGCAVLMRVTLDGKSIASLGPGNFVVRAVSPGHHVVWTEMGGVTPPIPAETTIMAEPDSFHVLKAGLAVADFSTNKIKQVELDSERGPQTVRESRLVQWQSVADEAPPPRWDHQRLGDGHPSPANAWR